MNTSREMLEVVDENDEIRGLETRETIHSKGLLHREIHIWFITPRDEIIFQLRSKDKDTYPGKRDATVGGHVEPGMSYEETAVKECAEETGLDIDPGSLFFLTVLKKKTRDPATGLINNAFRSQYAYLYNGALEDLRVEKGKAEGFEARKIDDLPHLSKIEQDMFIDTILEKEMLALFEKARKCVNTERVNP